MEAASPSAACLAALWRRRQLRAQRTQQQRRMCRWQCWRFRWCPTQTCCAYLLVPRRLQRRQRRAPHSKRSGSSSYSSSSSNSSSSSSGGSSLTQQAASQTRPPKTCRCSRRRRRRQKNWSEGRSRRPRPLRRLPPRLQTLLRPLRLLLSLARQPWALPHCRPPASRWRREARPSRRVVPGTRAASCCCSRRPPPSLSFEQAASLSVSD